MVSRILGPADIARAIFFLAAMTRRVPIGLAILPAQQRNYICEQANTIAERVGEIWRLPTRPYDHPNAAVLALQDLAILSGNIDPVHPWSKVLELADYVADEIKDNPRLDPQTRESVYAYISRVA